MEIHRSGKSDDGDPNKRPTFKWSRDNGSLTFPIEELIGATTDQVRLAHLGRDEVTGLHVGDWVEVLDDNFELAGKPGVLTKIKTIKPAERIVTVEDALNNFDLKGHPKLRRWDMTSAGVPVAEEGEATDDGYLRLEKGVQVQFVPGTYKTGDYWIIPARSGASGATKADVEWPRDAAGNPVAQPPLGIHHHYCRLAVVEVAKTGDPVQFNLLHDCRKTFPSLCGLEGGGTTGPPKLSDFFVVRLERGDPNGGFSKLQNDSAVLPDEIQGGIRITCNDKVAKECIAPANHPFVKPVCELVVYLPFPDELIRPMFPDDQQAIGCRPTTLLGKLEHDQATPETFSWTPAGGSFFWLQRSSTPSQQSVERVFEFLRGRELAEQILAKLTVKGNFIWATERNDDQSLRYLDGTTFGSPASDGRTEINLPSGDGRPGEDFELWFWLVPEKK